VTVVQVNYGDGENPREKQIYCVGTTQSFFNDKAGGKNSTSTGNILLLHFSPFS
jgi:hypothetical protein